MTEEEFWGKNDISDQASRMRRLLCQLRKISLDPEWKV